jgi:hypothetical protein
VPLLRSQSHWLYEFAVPSLTAGPRPVIGLLGTGPASISDERLKQSGKGNGADVNFGASSCSLKRLMTQVPHVHPPMGVTYEQLGGIILNEQVNP